ncbi:hypothetical protein [Clostridium sp.]
MTNIKDVAEKISQLSEEEKCNIKEMIKKLQRSDKYKKLNAEDN